MKCHNDHCENEAVIECGWGGSEMDCKSCFLDNVAFIMNDIEEEQAQLIVKRILLENPDFVLENL